MTLHTEQHRRRGIALFEVILAAIMLGIGLSIALSLGAAALARQGLGERNMVAAWLADEQMGLVVMEGPQQFLRTHPTSGIYAPPFDEYSYEVEVQHISDWEPYLVTVVIAWDGGDRHFDLQSEIAPRQGEPEEYDNRRPLEPIDREAIYYEENVE
ncbi:MAG: hypothetical protein VX527_11605 [Planctomycetota bacterium]|nr:hypothetical protein [Planctomycetota bacterium]